jgi:hypothetical protein
MKIQDLILLYFSDHRTQSIISKMLKIMRNFSLTMLFISRIAVAIYSNLFNGRPSVAYPGLYGRCGVLNSNIYATDRVMTRYYDVNVCSSNGYFFATSFSNDCSLTISLPVGTMVKSVLLSLED